MRQLHLLIAVASSVGLLSPGSSALDLGPGQPIGSFKFGRMAAADFKSTGIRSGDELARTRSARSLGGSFDYPIAPHFHIGLGADLHYCYGRLLDITVNLKGLISSADGKVAFRPGIGLGGAASNVGVSLLTVRASGELQISVSRQFGVGLEVGVWYTPSGGDEEHSVRIGPVRYVRGAVLFSSGTGRSFGSPRPRHDPLPFQGAVKIGLTTTSKLELAADRSRKWTDRGFSVGVSADFPTPVLGFIGAALDWYDLGRSESLLLWGFRGSVISEIALGELRVRPVGLLGVGALDRTVTLERRTDHMVYGVSLESFWDVDAGPGWLLEIQYLKVGGSASRGVKLEPLVIVRSGMTF